MCMRYSLAIFLEPIHMYIYRILLKQNLLWMEGADAVCDDHMAKKGIPASDDEKDYTYLNNNIMMAYHNGLSMSL